MLVAVGAEGARTSIGAKVTLTGIPIRNRLMPRNTTQYPARSGTWFVDLMFSERRGYRVKAAKTQYWLWWGGLQGAGASIGAEWGKGSSKVMASFFDANGYFGGNGYCYWS